MGIFSLTLIIYSHLQTLETMPRQYPFKEMLTYNAEEHSKVKHSAPIRVLGS